MTHLWLFYYVDLSVIYLVMEFNWKCKGFKSVKRQGCPYLTRVRSGGSLRNMNT